MENPTVVHNYLNTSIQKPSLASTDRKFVDKCPKGNSYISSKTPIKTRGLDHIRNFFSKTGLSKQAIELISRDRREGTISNYESAWRKFCSYSGEQKIGPF